MTKFKILEKINTQHNNWSIEYVVLDFVNKLGWFLQYLAFLVTNLWINWFLPFTIFLLIPYGSFKRLLSLLPYEQLLSYTLSAPIYSPVGKLDLKFYWICKEPKCFFINGKYIFVQDAKIVKGYFMVLDTAIPKENLYKWSFLKSSAACR